MENSFEKAYTTTEISELLNIGTSTLRKWCLSLEKNGYQFSRTETQRRLFVDRDIIALRRFKELVKTGNMSLESASSVLISRFNDEAFSTGTPSVLETENNKNRSVMRSDEVITNLMEKIEKQNEFIEEQRAFNQELIKRLDKYQDYLDQHVKQRDEMLMETLNKLQSPKESEKKSFFGKLFGK